MKKKKEQNKPDRSEFSSFLYTNKDSQGNALQKRNTVRADPARAPRFLGYNNSKAYYD